MHSFSIDRVIETRVEVWENEKCGNWSRRRLFTASIWLALPPSSSHSPTILRTAKAMLRYLWMLCRVALWTQMVEQRINGSRSNPEVVGSIPTEVKRIFSLPSVVLWFPLLGLTPSGSFTGFTYHFNLHFRVNSLFHHLCYVTVTCDWLYAFAFDFAKTVVVSRQKKRKKNSL